MRTTDRSRLFRWNRLPFFGGLLAVLASLAFLSPPSSASAAETPDPEPTMTQVVPEPATLIFFSAAATALFRRRWTQGIR